MHSLEFLAMFAAIMRRAFLLALKRRDSAPRFYEVDSPMMEAAVVSAFRTTLDQLLARRVGHA